MMHEHEWSDRSTHVTSSGWLVYRACRCGAWQVTQPWREAQDQVLAEAGRADAS
ncbi:hypothetical protein [Aquipuribacter sp. SD81]|uniref:hypothetical protein n=1 Tax=Aquipuribacter sp. SD81 TaxID=3127703 RepID=UPI00301B01BE